MLGDKLFSGIDSVNRASSIAQSTKISMESLLGGTPGKVPRMYEMSKITNLIKGFKELLVLIIEGSYDSNLPVEPARILYNEMKKRNMTISYFELPLVEHAFDIIFPNSSIVGLKLKREVISWMESYH